MFKLIPSEEYLDSVTDLIKSAQKNIYIQAMYICFDDSLKEFVDEVIKAKKRGVDIKINIDHYSLPYNIGHRYLIHLKKEKRDKCLSNSKKSKNYLDKLINSGVDIEFINKYKYGRFLSEYIPYLGRNHMKITIIDETSYIGGTNFSSKSFNYHDFMVKTSNKDIVSNLKDIFEKNRENNHLIDKLVKINEDNILLVDSGKFAKSIIYDETINHINKAKDNIKYISQFFPDFKLLSALKKASDRGVNVEVISHSNSISEKKYRHVIEKFLFNISNSNIANVYENSQRYIHAKMIIIDKDTINQSLIFGSHNFSTFGVLFGTSEVALYTKDSELIPELYNWYSEIKSRSDNLIKYSIPSQPNKHE